MAVYRSKRAMQPQIISFPKSIADEVDAMGELNRLLRSLIKQFGAWFVRLEQTEGSQIIYVNLRGHDSVYVRDVDMGVGVFGFKQMNYMIGMLKKDPSWIVGLQFSQTRRHSDGRVEESEEVWAQFDGNIAVQFALMIRRT